MAKAKHEAVVHPNTTPEDRDLEPKFLLVYVAQQPMPSLRIGRTHARTYETLVELGTAANDLGLDEESLIGAWKLGKKLDLNRSAKTVRETKTQHVWGTE